VIQNNEILFSQELLRMKKIMIEKVRRLRNVGDPLSLSEVGVFVLTKLIAQVKFNGDFF
jgi:hypothetical protein